ncbi:MAG: VOC family protein, partial [Candidatus Eisenbacteria bacterium]|nr:VOC family protein [Candidatus Eisenbacteria bacterium]
MSAPFTYQPGHFCWTEIATRDIDGAKKFFTELFGWQVQSVPMPGEAGTYHLMQIDGKDVAGLYEMKGDMFEGVPPHMSSYIWTNDTDATAAKVKELGGTVVAEPFDVPMVGRMAVCQDPTGATFSLFHGDPHPGAAQG